MYDIEKHRRHH